MTLKWFLELIVLWLSFSVVIVATGWYLASAIRPLCPDWWRRVVVDEEPELRNFS